MYLTALVGVGRAATASCPSDTGLQRGESRRQKVTLQNYGVYDEISGIAVSKQRYNGQVRCSLFQIILSFFRAHIDIAVSLLACH